nr:hypothetical protein [Tanacetum cinerariifolium]
MADPIFTNHVSVTINNTHPLPQRDIVMTVPTTETISPEVALPHAQRRRFRSVRHDDMIDRLCDQLEDMSLDRMEAIEYDVETLEARVDVAELRVEILQLALADDREEIMDMRTRASAQKVMTMVFITCGIHEALFKDLSLLWVVYAKGLLRRLMCSVRGQEERSSRVCATREGAAGFDEFWYWYCSNNSSNARVFNAAHYMFLLPIRKLVNVCAAKG